MKFCRYPRISISRQNTTRIKELFWALRPGRVLRCLPRTRISAKRRGFTKFRWKNFFSAQSRFSISPSKKTKRISETDLKQAIDKVASCEGKRAALENRLGGSWISETGRKSLYPGQSVSFRRSCGGFGIVYDRARERSFAHGFSFDRPARQASDPRVGRTVSAAGPLAIDGSPDVFESLYTGEGESRISPLN